MLYPEVTIAHTRLNEREPFNPQDYPSADALVEAIEEWAQRMSGEPTEGLWTISGAMEGYPKSFTYTHESQSDEVLVRDLWEWGEFLSNAGDHPPQEAFLAYIDHKMEWSIGSVGSAYTAFQAAYAGEHRDDEEFARDNLDSLYDIDSWVKDFIDYERMARSLMMDYEVLEGMYYFRR